MRSLLIGSTTSSLLLSVRLPLSLSCSFLFLSSFRIIPPANGLSIFPVVPCPHVGPLGSITGSGDDLLIDGLPIGNFFGFAWNLLVSLSFQFVGFLLTFVLHTTHAAKYGSQAGLGITLIQYGFYLRTRADEILSGELIPDGLSNGTSTASGSGFGLGAGSTMGVGVEGMDHSSGRWWGSTDPNGLPAASIPTFGSKSEGDAWMRQHANGSTNGWGGMGDNQPTAMEIGQANAWLSFVLMSVGWFVLLMSLGGYWRVKRYGSSSRLFAPASEMRASMLIALLSLSLLFFLLSFPLHRNATPPLPTNRRLHLLRPFRPQRLPLRKRLLPPRHLPTHVSNRPNPRYRRSTTTRAAPGVEGSAENSAGGGT
jgi:hypothetical protein